LSLQLLNAVIAPFDRVHVGAHFARALRYDCMGGGAPPMRALPGVAALTPAWPLGWSADFRTTPSYLSCSAFRLPCQ
jgi:hypothetical protein